jgi:hypothetical protein
MPNPVLSNLKQQPLAAAELLDHPVGFPLEVAPTGFLGRLFLTCFTGTSTAAGTGLKFFTGRLLGVGSTIRLGIPLRHKVHRFHARVVRIRHRLAGYEIEAVIHSPAAATRLRLVERICALECALLRPA